MIRLLQALFNVSDAVLNSLFSIVLTTTAMLAVAPQLAVVALAWVPPVVVAPPWYLRRARPATQAQGAADAR